VARTDENLLISSNLEVGTSNLFVNTANGNVGIGTTDPVSLLTVNPIPLHRNNYNHSEAPITVTNLTPTSTAILNDPKSVLHLAREGTNAQAYGARASFKLSRYENNSTNSRTRLDLDLAHEKYDDVNVMTFQSNGDVYANGRIFNNNPVFHAYQAAGAYGTATGVYNDFTSTFINRGNHYHTSGGNQGRFVAPVAGVYYFSANMLHRYSSAAGSAELTFYKNGTNISPRALGYTYVTGPSDHDNLHIEAMLSLAANDYIQVGVKALGVGTDIYYGESLANFRGFLIG